MSVVYAIASRMGSCSFIQDLPSLLHCGAEGGAHVIQINHVHLVRRLICDPPRLKQIAALDCKVYVKVERANAAADQRPSNAEFN